MRSSRAGTLSRGLLPESQGGTGGRDCHHPFSTSYIVLEALHLMFTNPVKWVSLFSVLQMLKLRLNILPKK